MVRFPGMKRSGDIKKSTKIMGKGRKRLTASPIIFVCKTKKEEAVSGRNSLLFYGRDL